MEVLENASNKYLEGKEFIEQNMKKLCQREHVIVEKVIYLAVFL